MKFLKILAAIMAVCLLGTAFIACDKSKGDKDAETTAAAATKVSVNLVIKDGSTTVYEGKVTCDGTLRNALEEYCAIEFEQESGVFDSLGLLQTIGELTAANGKKWIAYYEDEGQSSAFGKISTQTVIDGKTVVVVLK